MVTSNKNKNKIYDITNISPWYQTHTVLKSPLLRDTSSIPSSRILTPRLMELELYFNDIYHLLNRTLLKLTYEPEVSQKDEQKIQHLVEELLEVKKMLCTIKANDK